MTERTEECERSVDLHHNHTVPVWFIAVPVDTTGTVENPVPL